MSTRGFAARSGRGDGTGRSMVLFDTGHVWMGGRVGVTVVPGLVGAGGSHIFVECRKPDRKSRHFASQGHHARSFSTSLQEEL
jgi:hypothetical protein